MGVVIAYDPFGAGDGLLQCAKGHQTFADRVIAAITGVLYQGWLTRGQVTNRAIAEPTTLGLDVDPLSSREFSARILHVAAKCVRIGNNPLRVRDLPTMPAKGVQVPLIGRMDIEGEFEGLVHALGQLDEFP